MKNKLALLLFVCTLTVGCAKNVVTAPVPGSNSTADADAFRVLADAQAALHSIKTWEQCSVGNFPPTVLIDSVTEPCDAKAGVFPTQFVPLLNDALTAYNNLAAAGQAFHNGTGTDVAGLQALETQLQTSVSTLTSKVGGQ